MSSELIELAVSRPFEAIEALEASGLVTSASLFGDGLHLTVEKGATDDEKIKELLLEKGFEVYSLNRARPSLEDVFVHLIEREDALSESGHK